MTNRARLTTRRTVRRGLEQIVMIKKMLDFLSTIEMKLLDVLEFLKVLMNLLEILLDMLESWVFDEKSEIQLLDSLDMLGG